MSSPANDDTRVARDFHDDTTHTPSSVRASRHTLDWDVKPLPFKIYADVPAISLPRDLPPVSEDTLAVLGGARPTRTRGLTLEQLAAILYHAAGVTKKKTYPGGVDVLFRAAASTGALYQTEAYVVAGSVDGLAAGLYHFCPGDFALRRLRDGDVRGPLADAVADERIARRAATIVLSAIYWRNTWKYQARGFRHLFWDSGTMLANLLATSETLGMAPVLFTGFVDAHANRLLGLDADRETALEMVALGPDTAPAPRVTIDDIHHATVPLSSDEVDYPSLRAMVGASSLETPSDVVEWRRATPPPRRSPSGPLTPLPPPSREAGRSLGDTIQHRGSTREFSHAPIGVAQLATVLWAATRAVESDVPLDLTELGVVANAVDGVAPGAYVYRPDDHALELVRHGEFRGRSAYLALEQSLGGDAAAAIYFLAPLSTILETYGNRGYRLANLAAGLQGGRAYLAAYAQDFGATGLTFYDGLVVEFFSPQADGQDAIFVVAVGHSRRRARSTHAVIPVTSRLGG